MKYIFSVLVLMWTTVLGATNRPNVLFISIDDLRPELGCYGSPVAKSPNLDKLAAEGRRFDRAYCQQAICSPSRVSLLSGTRPDTNGVTHNLVEFRALNPRLITLPQHFRMQGYETVFCGKIFHGKATDDAYSWSRKPATKLVDLPRPKSRYADPKNVRLRNENFKAMFEKYGESARRGLGHGPAYERADVPDHAYIDGYNTELAIATMRQMVEQDNKPFFMALGYFLPHLNWNAPEKYWDMYDRNSIPLATQVTPPKGGAAVGLHPSFELRVRHGIPKIGPVDQQLSRTLKHAYLACVSYVDAQIGRAIAALDELGIRENTIIVVWGDHGWHLGDMGVWGKATNYEIATRVPLIVSAPGMRARGAGTKALVELVDLYPTLCELAGIPQLDQLEGKSFVPLLKDPTLDWKKGAVSQFPSPALREWAANPLSQAMRETFFGPLIEEVEARIIQQQDDRWDRELFEQHLMGYAYRSDRYRLITWLDTRDALAAPLYVELFDHETDPEEACNVAAEYPEIVAELRAHLKKVIKR